jgi:pimeloyl-ACP methyl ester carboxylesterase
MIETRAIVIDDLAFTVDVAGPPHGAPVLLLHGFPETRHMWRHQLDALSRAGYRAIAPDQRGYSADARPAALEAYATERLLADALSLMDAQGCARFHLVGHDWGGQLAWLIAANHGDRLLSLSVISRPHPAAFTRAMKEDAAQAERSRHHRSFRADDAIARMREANLKPLRDALERQAVPAADAAIYISALSEPGAIEGAMYWYRAGSLGSAETPAIATPTLFVWGRNDATVGAYAAELTAQYVTGPYKFVPVDNGTHFLVDQFPELISGLILEHLREPA